MKLKSALLISSLALTAVSIPSHADSADLDAQTMLVIAKYSGGCGILNQMAQFQGTTKMAGGTEFLARFLATEAARLGTTPSEYMARCKTAIETYNGVFEASAAMKDKP